MYHSPVRRGQEAVEPFHRGAGHVVVFQALQDEAGVEPNGLGGMQQGGGHREQPLLALGATGEEYGHRLFALEGGGQVTKDAFRFLLGQDGGELQETQVGPEDGPGHGQIGNGRPRVGGGLCFGGVGVGG